MWNGKQCAVCLTYDDALEVQLNNVVPLLDSLGFNATFYLSVSYPGFTKRVQDWKTVAERGNELGNHTLFHPCEGKTPGREWVTPEYDLNHYTMQRLVDEIKMTNVVLNVLDGKEKRTFAYPCADTKIGDSSYVPKIKDDFIAARGAERKMQTLNEIDLLDIGAYEVTGQSGDELIDLVKKAMNKKVLLVFLFHGVGGGHSINVSVEAHSKLLHFLKQNEKDIWVAPLRDIAEYIKEQKERIR
jgi:peptidoglycan/xylan/chitin deacetylase (PgdA/CDA1 family)